MGNKEDKKELEKSLIKIRGVDPNYDEESIHIGLLLNEDHDTTGKRNVEERIAEWKRRFTAEPGRVPGVIGKSLMKL